MMHWPLAGLEDRRRDAVKTFSGGMKRRLMAKTCFLPVWMKRPGFTVDFYLFSARAQLAEETGELNECLRIFDRMAEAIVRTPAIGLLGIYHAVGRTGIYLKQMDRERAASNLAEAGRGLNAFPDFPFLMTYGLAYNQLKYDLIFGDPEKAEKSLRRLLSWSSRDIRTILTCDRLLVHLIDHAGALAPTA